MSGSSAAEAVKKIRLQIKCRAIEESELEFQSEATVETGSFGKVRKGRWKDKMVAVKYFLSAEEKRGYKQELVFLSSLQTHENIIVLYGTGLADRTREPYFVMELAPYSLERVLHRTDPSYSYGCDHVMHWSRQAAVGLDYIHCKRILHRDIKSSNLLLFGAGGHLKLCDFGTCRNLETNLLYTASIGTVRYMAPEVIQGESYTTKCDIFSFGITLWEMLARKVPTVNTSAHLSSFAILYGMVQGKRPPLFIGLPKFVTELLETCWHQDPQERLSSSEVARKLTSVCEYFPFGRPIVSEDNGEDSYDGSLEEGTVTVTDDSLQSVDGDLPTPLIEDRYLHRTQSEASAPTEPAKKDVPRFSLQSQNPLQDAAYKPPNKIGQLEEEPFVNTVSRNYAVVDHEVHEFLDPHSEDNKYTSLDDSILRFNARCQYQHIEQTYGSLPSDPSKMIEDESKTRAHSEPKDPPPETVSPYYIPGLPPSLQPLPPNENDPESLKIWQNYKKLSEKLAKS